MPAALAMKKECREVYTGHLFDLLTMRVNKYKKMVKKAIDANKKIRKRENEVQVYFHFSC